MYSSPPPSLPSAPAPPRRRAMSRSKTPVPRPQPVFGAGSIRQVKKFHSYDDPHRLTTLLFSPPPSSPLQTAPQTQPIFPSLAAAAISLQLFSIIRKCFIEKWLTTAPAPHKNNNQSSNKEDHHG